MGTEKIILATPIKYIFKKNILMKYISILKNKKTTKNCFLFIIIFPGTITIKSIPIINITFIIISIIYIRKITTIQLLVCAS
jgi:hypothetical protein